ncbi:ABC transporter ATP-binding protein [Halobacillus fulvus]|nr:ABC transporter ATP-binding protein [Halobacillus fulvus]
MEDQPMSYVLEANDLTKQFHKERILNRVQFQLKKGEVLSIVGPSGSGKTTLLRTLAGLEKPTEGTLSMSGHDITEKKANERSIGLVFQQPLLFPHMTVEENIRYGAKFARSSKKDSVTDLLSAIELSDYRGYYPAEISGGQQQRVALARAIATEPDVILFDEPFSSLDPKLRHDLRIWLREFLAERSITSIFVTHDTEEAMLMGDRVGVFHEGTFQQIDRPEVLYKEPANAFVARFIGGHFVLSEHEYIPLSNCSVTTNAYETGRRYMATIQHITFQHGQTIAHMSMEDLNKTTTLPVAGAEVGQTVWLSFPDEQICAFGGRAV